MLETFRQALTLLDDRERLKVYLLLVLSGLSAIVQTVAILSVMPFIVLLANPDMLEGSSFLSDLYHFLPTDSYSDFLMAFGAFGVLVLTIGNAFVAVEHWVSSRFFCFLGHRIEKLVLHRMLRQPYEYFLRNNTARLSDIVLTQVERVVDGVIGCFIGIFGHAMLAVFVVLVLLVANPQTTVVTLVGLTALYTSIYILLKPRIAHHGRELTRLSGDVFTVVRETLDGIKEIKIRRAENYFARRFERPGFQMSKLALRFGMLSFLPNFILETAVFTALVVVALYFIVSTHDTGVSLSYIALYGIAIYRLVPSLKGIFEGMADLQHNADAVRIVLEHSQPQPAVPAGTRMAPLRHEILLENISVRLDESAEPQLSGVTVSIPAGSSVCLFGASGAGKSTLLNVLVGLIRPAHGRLLCDGKPITRETIEAWRQVVGYCPQDVFLFDDTIATNIAFGVHPDKLDRLRIREVAAVALADRFMNDGTRRNLDATIGEDGKTLSGGQRQRVGIARALYHDPDVLVLDEATTGLDEISRRAILDHLFSMKDKTLVFSSHDTEVAARCDAVVVLDGGRVIATGRYEELANTSQRFRKILSEIDP